MRRDGGTVAAVILRRAELDAIRAGEVDLAFRRWDRPRLKLGTGMRTAIGIVEVTSVEQVALEEITEAEALRAGARSRDRLVRQLEARNDRPIYRVGLRYAGPDPRVALREDAALDDAARAAILTRLDRLDRASPRGAWTRATLALIEASPATRAPDLAATVGHDTPSFKRDVRKLKELGLTESLEVGYRLSPRGKAVMRR